jgi:PAS domain S-box-containing protein
MALFRDMPIGRKLMVIIMVTCSAALLLSGVAIVVSDTILFRNYLSRDMRALAQVIADNSTAALAFENPQDARETLASLRARPNLVQACIYTTDLRVFATYARPGAVVECPATPEADSERRTSDALFLFYPIVLQERRLGTLYFHYEFGQVAERQRLYLALVAAIAAASMALALILSSRLRLLVSRPIMALAGSATAISESKDYSVRAEKQTQDEVGLLVDAFNNMVANIQQRDTQLIKSKEELEDRVRERTAELQEKASLLDLAHDGIFVRGPDRKIEYWSKGAEEMYGWTAEDALGRVSNELLATRFPHPLDKIESELARTGRWEGDLVHTDKMGRQLVTASRWAAQRDQAGRLRGALEINHDITERKRMEGLLRRRAAELSRSNAELEQFAYVASHDLQEPLRVVTTYMRLLQNQYQGKLDADADEYIGYAVDSASRMRQLITDLLSLSRASTKAQEIGPVEVEGVFKDALANLGAVVEETGASVSHDPLPSVIADRSQLIQLLQNLIGNAIKFSGPRAPHVHVSSKRMEQEWLFSVRDNGIGISPEHRERIFIVFQRLHDRTEYPGTGVGLAICKKIVERHGGRIWVESQPGEGSTFYFTIPLRAVEFLEETSVAYSDENPGTRGTAG